MRNGRAGTIFGVNQLCGSPPRPPRRCVDSLLLRLPHMDRVRACPAAMILSVLCPRIASMATLALNSGPRMRRLLMGGSPVQGGCPASEVHDGACPEKPVPLRSAWRTCSARGRRCPEPSSEGRKGSMQCSARRAEASRKRPIGRANVPDGAGHRARSRDQRDCTRLGHYFSGLLEPACSPRALRSFASLSQRSLWLTAVMQPV